LGTLDEISCKYLSLIGRTMSDRPVATLAAIARYAQTARVRLATAKAVDTENEHAKISV